jgi:hypothetical protein
MDNKTRRTQGEGNTKSSSSFINNNIQNFYVDKKEKIIQELLKKRYSNITWKPWQQDIFYLIDSEPDKRKIHWFCDKIGGAGKSWFVKYISMKYGMKYGCIDGDGKQNHLFNQIRIANEKGQEIKLVIVDCPRDMLGYINYGMIESIKNGMIICKGRPIYFHIPHVIIMANEPPKMNKWSEDRYAIRYI